ncbi:MAG: cell division protein ZapA [Proteobacteria bacterium]|nr:cell division protein ZapA [Pseudomonadota bacterium]MBU1150756.1 cell division protein ZapA [Pseudomonadota bacterium]MBU1184349.1 cell division protein ZapA [Pseudomonadota bacterium]MBU2026228.1 cell division protein ZapA [Pseudomonadota bacterium]MBU4120126.1 cell division protein ZapA [Pseudomonadota bacterium]
MKKRFEVRILGQDLSVISDSGDEHVENVIRYVSEKVEEAGKAAGSKNALNIAILAALNIADEYLRMMGVKENIYSQLESRSEQLIHLINDIR